MKSENYVSYEQAIKLKELGYDEQCRAFYWTADGQFKETDKKIHANNPNCTTMVAAPHVWDVLRWLREEHDFHIHVAPCVWTKTNVIYDVHWVWNSEHGLNTDRINGFEDYDTALLVGIDKVLELPIKKKGEKK